MSLIEKAWGTTEALIELPTFSQHRLQIARGGYCSIHFHERKTQVLVVLEGRLLLRLFDPCGRPLHVESLEPGAWAMVVARLRHQFIAEEPSVAIECYFPATPADRVDEHDIVRLSIGGMNEADCES